MTKKMSKKIRIIIANYDFKFISIIWIGCIIVLSFFGILFSTNAEFSVRQIKYTLRENYEHVFFSENGYHTNCFHYAGNSVTLFTEDKVRLQSEVLVQSDKSTYNYNSFRRYTNILSPGEIAISKNLARTHGLKIGDNISIVHPSSVENFQVVIVNFFDDTFGLRRTFMGNAVVILGYNQLIAENTLEFVSFITDDIFSSDDAMYFLQDRGIIILNELIVSLIREIFVRLMLPILIIGIMQYFVCYYFIIKICGYYYFKQQLFGRRISETKQEVLTDCFLIVIPIALAGLLVNSISTEILLGYAISITALTLFIFQCMCIILSFKMISYRITRT